MPGPGIPPFIIGFIPPFIIGFIIGFIIPGFMGFIIPGFMGFIIPGFMGFIIPGFMGFIIPGFIGFMPIPMPIGPSNCIFAGVISGIPVRGSICKGTAGKLTAIGILVIKILI